MIARWFDADRRLIFLAWLMTSAVFYIPFLLGDFPFHGVRGEMLMQWLPFRFFMLECYGEGVFPLWNPYVFGGMPFWGYSHTMSAYPLMMTSLLPPTLWGVTFFYLAHVFIGCWGSYRLPRLLGSDRPLSFLGVFLLIGSSLVMMPITREFYISLAFMVWLAPLIYLAIMAAEKRSRAWFAALTLALSMQLMTGEIEGIFFNLGFTMAFLVIVRPGFKEIFKEWRWLILAAAFGCAVLISAAMWFPLAEYMPHNVRNHGVTFELFEEMDKSVRTSLENLPNPLLAAVVFFLPSSPLRWYMVFFIGYYFFKTRDRSAWVLLGVVLMTITYCARVIEPMERIVYHVPILNMFLKRGQGVDGSVFMLHLMALWGMREFIASGFCGRDRMAFRIMVLIGLAGSAGAFVIPLIVAPNVRGGLQGTWPAIGYVALVVMAFYPGQRVTGEKWARVAVTTLILAVSYMGLLFSIERRDADYMHSEPFKAAALKMDRSSRYLIASTFNIGNYEVLYTQQSMIERRPEVFGWNRVPPRGYMELLQLIDPAIVKFEDGKLAGWDFVFYHPNGSLLRSDSLALPDLLGIKYAFNRNVPIRHASPTYLGWLLGPGQAKKRGAFERWRDVFIGNEALVFEFPAANSQSLKFKVAWDKVERSGREIPCKLRIESDGAKLLERTIPIDAAEGGPGESARIDRALPPATKDHRSLSIKLTIPPDISIEGLRLADAYIEDPLAPLQSIHQDPLFDLYENGESFPLQFMTHAVEFAGDKEEAMTWLGKASRDRLRTAALLVKSPLTMTLAPDSAYPVPLSVYKQDRVIEKKSLPGVKSYSADVKAPGILIVTQNRLPGWTARVDGRESAIIPADWAFMGLPLAEGKHEIELIYRPVGFRVGLWTTLAAALSFALFCLFAKLSSNT